MEVKSFFEKQGAEIMEDSSPRKTRFAYPIKKEEFGFSSNLVFRIDGSKLESLVKELNLSNLLLRYVITKVEDSKGKDRTKSTRTGPVSRPAHHGESGTAGPGRDFPKEKELSNEALEKKIEEISK